MNAILRRAAAKKQKFLAKKKKYQEEQEETLSDVDEMEVSENMLGKLFNDRYLTLKYLGSGTFSKVWLVYDIPTDEFYAMKMYYPKYQEDGEYEVRYLKQLRNTQNVVKLFNDFTFKDANDESYKQGESVCLIVELMGRSLMTVFNMYDKGVPFDIFRNLTYNALVSLNEIHAHGIIHTDIKLENLMLNQLTGEVKAIMEWFQGLKPEQIYESYLNSYIPPNWKELGKNKQKSLKKKIRIKAAKSLTTQFHTVIVNHVNEMSQYKVDLDNNENDDKESSLNNQIDIDDMPALVNLEDVKKQEIEEGRTIREDEDEDRMLHDDELDMDLIKSNVKIADLGNACPVDNIDDDDIQIRSYRAPEVVMGEMYDGGADIWSMACLFYELLTHDHLFEVDSEHDDNVEQDRYLLSQMYATLGKMPYDYCIDSERTYQLFDEKGRIKKFKKIDYHSLEDRINEKRPDLTDIERQQASQLIRSMLHYELKKRASARDCMKMDIYTSL